jgi:hypothetical protein
MNSTSGERFFGFIEDLSPTRRVSPWDSAMLIC